MKRLRQPMLYRVLKRRKRPDSRTLLYILNNKFLTIRKQKDRRRRRALKKLGVQRKTIRYGRFQCRY